MDAGEDSQQPALTPPGRCGGLCDGGGGVPLLSAQSTLSVQSVLSVRSISCTWEPFRVAEERQQSASPGVRTGSRFWGSQFDVKGRGWFNSRRAQAEP